MNGFNYARILLFVMAASSAYALAQSSTAAFGLSRNATATKEKWTSILTSESALSTGDPTCRVVVTTISTVAGPGSTRTVFVPKTIYITITYTLAESSPATQRDNVTVFPRETMHCSDCIRTTTGANRHEARSTAHPIPEARESSSLTRNNTACFTETVITVVTLPGSTETKFIPTTTSTTIFEMLPPKMLTSAEFIDGPSETIEDNPPTKTPNLSTARSSIVAPATSRASPEPKLSNTSLPPKPITNIPDDSTPNSKPISPVTSLTLVAPSAQTPAANSITSTFTTTPSEETQAWEAPTSTTKNSFPGIVTTQLGVPLQPPLSSPPSPSGLSPEPNSGQTGLRQQTQNIQTPTILQSQQQTSSPLPIFATSILVKEATEEVAQATPPVITLGTNTYSPIASSAIYLINSQTLAPGGAAITISNSILSLARSPNEAIEAVVPATPPVITLGTNTYSPVASSAVYLINGQTLAPGGAAVTVSNLILSLAPSATQLIVAPPGSISSGQAVSPATTIGLIWEPSSTSPIAPNPTSAPAPVIATIQNSPVTLYPGASSLVYTPLTGSPVTILPGSAAQTLPGGTIISLSPAGSSTQSGAAPPVLIISNTGASTTQTITFPNAPSPSGAAPPVLIISDTGASTAQTITFSNVPSAGSLGTPASGPPSMISSNYIPIRISDPGFIVVDNTITLTPGAPAATASGGIAISLGTSNSVLVVGSSTITLAPTATGIGGYLYSALETGDGNGARTGSGFGSGSSSTSGSELAPGSVSATTSPGTGPGTGMVTSTLSASRGANDASSDIPSPTQSQPPSSDAVQQSNAVARSVTLSGRDGAGGKLISWLLSLLLSFFIMR